MKFQEKIFTFYKEHGRDLPWRKTQDPYKIMVSEVMLQQTQVERVIPKYELWMKNFPTKEALAKAPLADVLKLWSGLGYNSRAKRLQDACKLLANKPFPRTVQQLLELPGIGPYTARSILIFAYNQDLATVDTNIRRILMYEFPESEEKELFSLAESILPKGRSRDWHNALMDYGAMVLTSKKTGIKPKTTQSSFKHSKRWYRGKIIKYLTGNTVTESELNKLYPESKYSFESILSDLVKEGMIVREGDEYKLP